MLPVLEKFSDQASDDVVTFCEELKIQCKAYGVLESTAPFLFTLYLKGKPLIDCKACLKDSKITYGEIAHHLKFLY